MNAVKHARPGLSTFLKQKHKIILDKADVLCDALQGLHYEGKVHLKENMKKLREVIKFFKERLMPHIIEDEKILFPFVEKHIPRLEPMIAFLRSEHVEFKTALRQFNKLFKEAETPGRSVYEVSTRVTKLRRKGTYLMCLLRSHIQTETESIYKAIMKDLKKREKDELIRSLQAFCDGYEKEAKG